MNIHLYIGSSTSNEADALFFYDVKDIAQLEKIKKMAMDAGIYVYVSSNDACPTTKPDDAYTITFYPDNGARSFKNLFENSRYLTFKAAIVHQFPKLERQFLIEEEKAKNEEELSQVQEELNRFQFYSLPKDKDRFNEFKQEISPEEEKYYNQIV